LCSDHYIHYSISIEETQWGWLTSKFPCQKWFWNAQSVLSYFQPCLCQQTRSVAYKASPKIPCYNDPPSYSPELDWSATFGCKSQVATPCIILYITQTYSANLSCVHKYESTYSLKYNSTHLSSLFHKIVLLTGHILDLNAIIYCIHNICIIHFRCTHHTISLCLLCTNSVIIC
jgi:hypothetical protein